MYPEQALCCRKVAFHCEVSARPEVLKQRAQLTKQDMLAMALRMYQQQLKQAEVDDMRNAAERDIAVDGRE